MKLHKAGYQKALQLIRDHQVSWGDWDADGDKESPRHHLGEDLKTGELEYCFGKASTCYAARFATIATKAMSVGHVEVGEAANRLLELVNKEYPNMTGACHCPPDGPCTCGMRKHLRKPIIPVTDQAFLAKLWKASGIKKEAQKAGSFWALATVENPKGDRDGDVIDVDGIEWDTDQMPLLPAHKRSLPHGHAPELGMVREFQRTEYKGMKALAFRAEWALDESGDPIDDLVKSYYVRYRNGFTNGFSVGMNATAQGIPVNGGGTRWPKTKLFEISCVSLGGNADAVGLTRSLEGDEALELVKKMDEKLAMVLASGKELEKRLDQMEATVTTALADRVKNNNGDQDAIAALNRWLCGG